MIEPKDIVSLNSEHPSLPIWEVLSIEENKIFCIIRNIKTGHREKTKIKNCIRNLDASAKNKRSSIPALSTKDSLC